MVATAVEGHSPVADVFACNPSNICAAFYTISTDSVLAWFLCNTRASCLLELLMFSDFRPSVFNVLSDSCNTPMFRL